MKCKRCGGTGKEEIPIVAEEILGMNGVCKYTMLVKVRCIECGGKGWIEEDE